MTKIVSFTPPSNKDVKSILEQIKKQQITVGGHLQSILLADKEAEGVKVKNVREYMESQRAYVWENWRASNLIQSILLNSWIPDIILYRYDDKSQFRKVIDGQQRLTTTYLFVNDCFKLDLSKSMYPVFEIEGERYTYEFLQNKKFSELPEIFRDSILNYDIKLVTANNCTDEQAERIYVSMNAGVKPLKPAEVRNAAMGINTRRFIGEVLKSDWILHTMTAKAATTNVGNEIITHVITLMHHNSAVELSKETIDNAIYSYRDNGLTDVMKEDITNVCNYLNEVTSIWIELKKKHDEQQTKKKGKGVSNYSTYRFSFFNKTHTVMLMIAADKAIKANVPVKEFATWSRKFFEFQSEDYKKGMDGKANELQNVDMRMLAIQDEVSKLKKGEVYVVKKATAEEVFAVLDELKNDDTVINDNTVSDTTNTDAQPNQEVVSESIDNTEENVQDDGIEVKELTIDDIPNVDELEDTQEDNQDQEQAS